MHGRIFEVKSSLSLESKLDSYLIPEWFSYYADYWDKINGAIVCDYSWLNELTDNNFSIDKDENDDWSLEITDDNRGAYLKPKYEKFITLLNKLSETSFEQFKGNNNWGFITDWYELQDSYRETSGYWIYVSDNDELLPLDDFVRQYSGKWYLGNVMGYHHC